MTMVGHRSLCGPSGLMILRQQPSFMCDTQSSNTFAVVVPILSSRKNRGFFTLGQNFQKFTINQVINFHGQKYLINLNTLFT